MKKILSAIAALFCAATFATHAPEKSALAEEKHNYVLQMIEQTIYETLPKHKNVDLKLIQILNPHHLAGAFEAGEVMPKGRQKVLHEFGTVVAVRFNAIKSALGLSGIFSFGSQYGLLRLSLAVKPKQKSEIKFTPGIALKFFVDADDSVNIFALPSLDGISTTDLFSENYVTALPEPKPSFVGAIGAHQFERGEEIAGFEDCTILALTNDHVAQTGEHGEKNVVVTPYSLIFAPSVYAKSLLHDREGDYRELLNGKGNGETLFEVYAVMTKGDALGHHIGSIVATSDFVASKYGDKKLRFAHPHPHKKMP